MTRTIKQDQIYMFWHKEPFGKENFGDVLGPYVVEHLTGFKPIYIPLLHSKWTNEFILTYLRAIYNLKLSLKDLSDNIKYIKKGKTNLLISIGSILDWYSDPNCDIWGAGIMFRNSEIAKANFYAVRGKYSQLRLKELGHHVPDAIGDPALLTPLLYTPTSEKEYALGIIPHFSHYKEALAKLDSEKILVINLFDDIEKVVEDVNSCAKIISSSLHGIIISHAYEIPALWFEIASGQLHGDNIKFADYFSSVEISEYESFSLGVAPYNEEFITTVSSIFTKNQSLISVDKEVLKHVQRGLINSAPFPVLPQYKNL